jgi:hypothetical protein
VSGTIPFRCAAFAIASRRSGGLLRQDQWLVDVRGIGWDDILSTPKTQDQYEEAAFRRLAALSGWRLVNVVAAGEKVRRLYFEKVG